MPALAAILCILVAACGGRGDDPVSAPPTGFSGTAAYEYARTQLDFGPRIPGTEGWQQTGDWLVAKLSESADTVIEQRWNHTTANGGTIPQRNILARFRPEMRERVLYLGHWDTRPTSDAADDPADRGIPVPGANDNAGGVGLLLALADVLKNTEPAYGVDILLVDGEDYGNFEQMTDVLIGSTYFAANLPDSGYQPLFGVVWDMIGDRDLRIRQEGHSLNGAPEVVARVWNLAADRGLSHVFVPEPGIAVTDDHLPLLRAGLRVIDVIDIDYEHHHKPTDTIDKISPASLQMVGDVATALVLWR
ncbi:MAG TPA: M28 family peptidase [Gemmatimonadaceae bacterium]|nr:M28 family peptidase [Gemmatimonadaceae bacterium]